MEQNANMVKGKKNLPSLGNETGRVDSDFDYFSGDENEEGIHVMEEYTATDTVQLATVQSMLQPRKTANMVQSSGPSDFVPKGSHKNKKKHSIMGATQAKMITHSNKPSPKNNDSTPSSSHKGKMVEISRVDFEEFALKPVEENDSSPADDYLFLLIHSRLLFMMKTHVLNPLKHLYLRKTSRRKS